MAKKKLNLWHCSDSHSYHHLLVVPEKIDIVIFTGDCSNHYDRWSNLPEAIDFIHWFGTLKIKHKVMIAGNHDSALYHKDKELFQWIKHYGIIYLENESVEIEGIKIWGSPITPTFGNWWFMKDRAKLDAFWKNIPEDTDVVAVHGPPKGILDLSYDRNGKLEYCGCKSLRNHILDRIKPKLCLFGHIHNHEDIINAGTTKLSICDTIFSNGSVVTDGKFGMLSSDGNVFEI
jgi:Icc-related predicted phosphoesterase